MRSVAMLVAVPVMVMGVNIYTATMAMSRPGQIMTTRDMNIECRGNGWVGRGARDCCSGRCRILKSKRCKCLGNKPSF